MVRFLEANRIEFEEVDITMSEEQRQWMYKNIPRDRLPSQGNPLPPQIFSDDHYCGVSGFMVLTEYIVNVILKKINICHYISGSSIWDTLAWEIALINVCVVDIPINIYLFMAISLPSINIGPCRQMKHFRKVELCMKFLEPMIPTDYLFDWCPALMLI